MESAASPRPTRHPWAAAAAPASAPEAPLRVTLHLPRPPTHPPAGLVSPAPAAPLRPRGVPEWEEAPAPSLRQRSCRACGRAGIALAAGGLACLIVDLITAAALHEEGQSDGSAFGWGGVACGGTLLVFSALACWLQRGDECGPEEADA